MTPEALIKETGRGLYVTELIGFGVNGVTGDYSRGAAGFWIEEGALTYPVSEITIAGNLKDMFLALTAAAISKLCRPEGWAGSMRSSPAPETPSSAWTGP